MTGKMMQLRTGAALLLICIYRFGFALGHWPYFANSGYSNSPITSSGDSEYSSSPTSGDSGYSNSPTSWDDSGYSYSPTSSDDSDYSTSPSGANSAMPPYSGTSQSPGANPGNAPYDATSWTSASATFYGGEDAKGTMGGACGYGNMYATGYGTATTAMSPTLFNQGVTCGACFELKCNLLGGYRAGRWCYRNAGSIIVTGTNLCPANWARTTDGWCNPPQVHFDLSYPSFAKLAQRVAGIIPIQYRRVPCMKQGGVKFRIEGNTWFNLVLVYNVAGPGSIIHMAIKGSQSPSWYTMNRNWGQYWQDHHNLQGDVLSFMVTTSAGTTVYIYNLTNQYWSHGSSFASNLNFGSNL